MTPPAAAAAAQAPPASRRRRAPAHARTAAPARIPRRVSGPARRSARTGHATIARPGALVLQLAALVERLAQHRQLDRLIRGRAWIGIVAFALIGIVTLQLALLKLNGGIGRALEQSGRLQRENAALSISNSELASTNRVQARASQLGMVFASPSRLRFLAGGAPRRSSVTHAAAMLAAPSQTSGSEGQAGGEASSVRAEGSEAHSSEASSSASSEATRAESRESSEAHSSSETPTAEAPPSETAASPSAEAASESGGASSSPGG